MPTRSLSNYIATAWLVILLAGTTIGATVLFAPPVAYAQCSERCKGVVVTLPDKGPIEIDEQVNHPWVKFEFKGTRYLAIEETIEIMPEHTDIYRFVMEDNGSNVFLAGAEKERLKLAEKEKAQLLGNPCVREEIVARLSWLGRNVHPPPILRSPEEARAYNRQRELEDSQPGPCEVPASNDSTISGSTGLVVTVPRITSVTPIIPTATQTIIITGEGFGSHPPYVGQNTPYIAFHDNTNATRAWWEAGHVTPTNWDAITLNVVVPEFCVGDSKGFARSTVSLEFSRILRGDSNADRWEGVPSTSIYSQRTGLRSSSQGRIR